MKYYPITDEVREQIDLISRSVWAAINGAKFTHEDLGRIAHFADSMRQYDDFAKQDDCPSILWHGPGHQSKCECELLAGHVGDHEGEVLGNRVSWRGLIEFTDFFDEMPEYDEV